MFWKLLEPLLFGSIGAAVLFTKISGDLILKSLVVICFGLMFRWFGAFTAAFEKKFTFRERAFMATAWIAKATV